MNYRFIILIFVSFFVFGCNISIDNKTSNIIPKSEYKYKNSGFALIFNNDIKNIKFLEPRSIVKISNPKNDKYLIARVKSNKVKFSNFYNSILSSRIAEELELDINEPYINIILISKDTTFVAKKTKMFEEEKKVAQKAPVEGILINDLNKKKIKKKIVRNKDFSYSIKIADFYYKETAKTMKNKIKNESLIKDTKIIKLSETKYRLLIGPFNDIKSLKRSFEMMNLFNFENLEILRNV